MTRHPDEGTLHAYMDEELSPAEATALEAHVAGCTVCAGALADARGLGAAASRVISALDAAPAAAVGAASAASATRGGGGTVRATATSRFRAPFARAAALLLLAGGTAVVIDRSGRTEPEPIPAVAPAQESVSPAIAAVARDSASAVPADRAEPASADVSPLSRGMVGSGMTNDTRKRVLRERRGANRTSASAAPTQLPVPAAPPPSVAGGVAVPRRFLPDSSLRLSEVVVTSAVSDMQEGTRIQRYRTKDGIVLTLTDEPLSPAAPVDARETRLAREQEARAARRGIAGGTARSTAAQMSAPAPAPVPPPTVNSYRWTSAEQGRSYTLTGALSVAELEALSKRLSELERLP